MKLTSRGRRGSRWLLTLSTVLFFAGLFLLAGTMGAEEFSVDMTAWQRALQYTGGFVCLGSACGLSRLLDRIGFFTA